jgi:uncharacterized protein with PIN domain
MSKSTAERQRQYRERRAQQDERRLSTWVSARADLALERLAKQQGQTKREVVERLVLAADASNDQVEQTISTAAARAKKKRAERIEMTAKLSWAQATKLLETDAGEVAESNCGGSW